jgi:hypothetical protein
LGEFVDPSAAAGFQRDLEAMTSAAVDELCRNTAEQRRIRIVAAAWPASTSAASVIESVYWRSNIAPPVATEPPYPSGQG